MDCFHQTNERKNSVLFSKTKEEPLLRNRRTYRTYRCVMFPFSNAVLSETANHTDPTQAGDEHSTQKSAKYMDDKFKTERNKIKPRKIVCEYIYSCRFLFFFFFVLYYF